MTDLTVEEPVGTLVTGLELLGVRLWVESGQLRFRAPQGVLTDERRAALRGRRDELIAHLSDGGPPALTADRAARHEPFPLSDVQSAYLLGRGRAFAYGGVGCHGYGELRYPSLDPDRMRDAWRALVARHDMLRAVVELDGSQRVLPEVPPFALTVLDLRGTGEAEAEAGVAAVRAEMDHRLYAVDTWPLFDARVTLTDAYAVLHVSIDFLVADFVSIQVLLDEVHQIYHHPERPLPPLDVAYRDYLLAERQLRAGARYERDRDYWLSRVDGLPAGPELPVLSAAPDAPPRFRRWQATIEPELWAKLRERAGTHGVSPSGAVLAAYADVLAAWSRHPAFTLNLTLLNRLPLHPQVPALIGDFTSVELLAVDAPAQRPGAAGPAGGAFDARARDLQARLWQDMDHRSFTGVEVMREITRRRGADSALFPVVFTSAIGLAGDGVGADGAGELGHGISQTPQVWLDCQNMERRGALHTNWDVREGVFPDGMVDAAFAAYEGLLRRLATDDTVWSDRHPVGLPAGQEAARREVNATAAPVPAGLLHEPVVAQALRTPDRIAVVSAGHAMTYAELLARAAGVADRLHAAGCRPGELVGIVMDRGWEQVVGALGTLLAGGVYVPVDTSSPPARRAQILTAAGVGHALTQSWLTAEDWPESVRVHPVDTLPPAAHRPGESTVEPTDLAYVIHTSGSTGAPKGVMISHRGALNTVVDVNTRFGVGPDDRVLALSNLGFDLSVYDIFGPLAVGGAIVIPARDKPGDPSHWADLVAEHRVTVWNSVPAQLQMLHDYLAAAPTVTLPGRASASRPAGLRLAMLSGDWIPVALPDAIRDRVPGLDVVSLGGATEASIWSILHPVREVDPGWRSIPYGRPMTNQTFHVLDAALRPRPDWVAGELYIGGVGVAEGYLNDPARTAERFVRSPATGDRLYRTGDLGRYLPGGDIELLGREDFQVKIRGYRIELAEIETAARAQPAVGGAVVLVDGDRPLERRLVAFVEPAPVTPGPGPDLSGLAESAVAAGDEAIAGVDRARYTGFAACLDRLAVPAMARTLQAAGLFAGVGDIHPYADILAAAKVAPRHHRLVRRWLRALTTEGVLMADENGYRLARQVHDLDQAWADVDALALPGDAGLLDYFRASIAHLPALLRGEQDPLALLFPEGRLDVSQELYEQALFNRWANRAAGAAVRRLADQRGGPVRVLEVGAGGGGTTAAVLDALDGVEVEYRCTDLSPYFLTQAQARFGDRPGIRFGVYDLDQDYRAQGLAPNSFDLVVAGDVLHATTNVDRVLGALRELLAPGGALVALEMTREHYQIMTSLELLVRLDSDAGDFTDERQGGDRVFLDRPQWLGALARAGGADPWCLPDAGGFIAELGMCVLVARFKTDRAPVDAGAVTAHLRDRLPEYMVPAVVQVVDALPLTGNGKVDRGALRRWLPSREAAVAVTAGAAPTSDLEARVAAVWAQALRLGRIGRDDNLFELGGDSLVAAQIAGRLLEEVPEAAGLFFDELLRELLEQPTVAALTARLAQAAPAASPETAGTPDATGAPDAAAAAGGSLVHIGGPAQGDTAIVIVAEPRPGPTDALLAHLPPGEPVYACAADPAGATLDRLAADRTGAVTAALAAAGAHQVRLVGVGLAAALAVEIGRVLTERGATVTSVTLVGGHRPGPGDPATGLADAVRRHVPTLYAGDLTVVRAARGPSAADESVDVWADICLGELRVVEVDADHDALLAEPHAAAVAGAVTGDAAGSGPR